MKFQKLTTIRSGFYILLYDVTGRGFVQGSRQKLSNQLGKSSNLFWYCRSQHQVLERSGRRRSLGLPFQFQADRQRFSPDKI